MNLRPIWRLAAKPSALSASIALGSGAIAGPATPPLHPDPPAHQDEFRPSSACPRFVDLTAIFDSDALRINGDEALGAAVLRQAQDERRALPSSRS